MSLSRLALCAVLALAAGTGAAQTLPPTLPLPAGAHPTHADSHAPDTYPLPVGPAQGDALPLQVATGRVTRQAWKIPAAGLTSEELIAPLRAALSGAGWDIALDCHAEACGGFDFRLGIEVINAPDMYLNLFDFRALTARRTAPGGTAGGATALFALASRDGAAGYLQLVEIAPDGSPSFLPTPDAVPGTLPALDPPSTETAPAQAPDIAPGTADGDAPPADSIAAQLLDAGHAVLSGLDFDTGSATLAEGDVPSLRALAGFLAEDPARRVLLVGHTDATGGADGNIALSRQRAGAVRTRLVERLGVAPGQVEADGIGFLAPRASNRSEAGRESNRRVEAVLLPVE